MGWFVSKRISGQEKLQGRGNSVHSRAPGFHAKNSSEGFFAEIKILPCLSSTQLRLPGGMSGFFRGASKNPSAWQNFSAQPGQPEAWQNFFFAGSGSASGQKPAAPSSGLAQLMGDPHERAWQDFFRAARKKILPCLSRVQLGLPGGMSELFFAGPRKILQHGRIFGPWKKYSDTLEKKSCHAQSPARDYSFPT